MKKSRQKCKERWSNTILFMVQVLKLFVNVVSEKKWKQVFHELAAECHKRHICLGEKRKFRREEKRREKKVIFTPIRLGLGNLKREGKFAIILQVGKLLGSWEVKKIKGTNVYYLPLENKLKKKEMTRQLRGKVGGIKWNFIK